MKILIVTTTDANEGAARAAYRLHQALLYHNINSQMLVHNKKGSDLTVISTVSKFQNIIYKLRRFFDMAPVLFYKNKTPTLFSPAWLPSPKTIKTINRINPDIVHLHWINGGMIRIKDLSKINAPIIWSLHDMWPFTGGCHYDEHCEGYKECCGNCKVLASSNQSDLSNKVFNRKNKTYEKIHSLTVIGLSRWLTKCASKSTLFRNNKIVNLPNPIDTSIFKPHDSSASREFWSLPKDKKLVLFGAMDGTSDPRKGFAKLSAALGKIKRDDMEFVVFGSDEPENPPKLGYKVHYLGRIYDDTSLVTLYNAVDVMVAPSLQENLSNAIMESLSTGTPVVGFDIGGNSDMINHKQNGYLSKPYEADDISAGINWILDSDQYLELCKNAREKVTSEFDSKIVAKKYISLYKETLKRQGN